VREQIRVAWEGLRSKRFPEPSSSPLVAELRADLANITTFGSGCVQAFLQRGRLGASHHAVLLRCLNGLQVLEGKIALATRAEIGCDPEEIKGVASYKEDLERILEAIIILSDAACKRAERF
jgi:hypothetical protein